MQKYQESICKACANNGTTKPSRHLPHIFNSLRDRREIIYFSEQQAVSVIDA
jgi:hypothetical protein